MSKGLESVFCQRRHTNDGKYVKQCSISQSITKIKSKPQTKINCWKEHKEIRTSLLFWWECKTVKPFSKYCGSSSKKWA